MANATDIRNRVIDSLMAVDNTDFLLALEEQIKASNLASENISLTEEQRIMLSMSDEDIKNGRLIGQNSLEERELEWLKKVE